MPVLQLRDAALERGGARIAGPCTAEVAEGARVAIDAGTPEAAKALAELACGMLRPSSGAVYVAAFDSRVQPAHVKRLAAYVPYEPFVPAFPSFVRCVEYRADLWGVSRAEAVVRARLALSRLGDLHEAFAYPVAAALCVAPLVLVLDRPQAVHARAIYEAAGACAVFSTHADEAAARAFGREYAST